MFTKSFAAAVALTATLASAQTHTDCNPLTTTCKPDPAFGKDSVNCDMTKGACDAFNLAAGTSLTYGGNGAVFSIKAATDAPTINTGKYIFFGKVEVEVQAAPGAGIVTSSVLQSDDLDEIDWEWVGNDNVEVQSNYYFQGKTGNYDRGAKHPVSNPTGSFHTYTVEWTPTAITWSIDGATVRTLEAAEATGEDSFPQSPMQVKLGTWCGGGPNSPPGTVTWAGGKTDFSQAPFNGYYKSISITDYAGKSGPTSESVKEYIYGDHSGTWQSIKVVGGSGGDDSSSSSSSSAHATKTSTKASETTTKAAVHTTKSEEHTKTTEAQTTTANKPTNSPEATTATTATQSAPASGTSAAVKPSSTGSGATQNGVAAGVAAIAGAIMLAQLF